jgi:tetratricopeptide (TPR) repeat protein
MTLSVLTTESRIRSGHIRSFILTIVILFALGAAFERNEVMKTPLSLWRDAADKNPSSSRVHANLGNSYFVIGRNVEAIEEYKKALSLNRYRIETYLNLGFSFENIGDLEQAIRAYDMFCKFSPLSDKQMLACDRAIRLTDKIRRNNVK